MLQFSLRNLLIAVAAVALGMASLLNANYWWSSLLWGATLAMLLFAGLATLLRREISRAYWGGVLLAGSLYLLLLMYSVQHSSASIFTTPNSPIVSFAPLSNEQLITTRLIRWGYLLLPATKTMQYLPPATTATGAGSLAPGGMGPSGGGMDTTNGMPGMPGGAGTPPAGGGFFPSGGLGGGGGFGGMGMAALSNPSYLDITAFTEVGHALWTLLFAWLGGLVAAKLYRTRQPAT